MPATPADKPFPLGDVSDPESEKIANDWFRTISEYSVTRFDKYVKSVCKPTARHGEAGKRTYEAALKLCEQWDYQRGAVIQHCQEGFKIACAFLNETQLLPAFDADFSEQIAEMNNDDKVATAQAFSRAAWADMEQSYPRIHAQFKRIPAFTRGIFWLDVDEGEEFLVAGMMLPYMFSYASQLEQQTAANNFTGMKVGTVAELEAMEFTDIFTA